MYFVRKFARAKYNLINGELAADAVTGCLRTSSNTLSFWAIPELTKDQLDNALLAMASGAEKLETVHLVTISQDFFQANGYQLEDVEGNTPIDDLKNSHWDLIKVNISVLKQLGGEIYRLSEESKQMQAEEFEGNLLIRTYLTTEIKKILAIAIKNGRLTKDQLSIKIQALIDD